MVESRADVGAQDGNLCAIAPEAGENDHRVHIAGGRLGWHGAIIVGLLAGRYLYAETSGYLASTIEKIGNRGGIMLPESFLGGYSR